MAIFLYSFQFGFRSSCSTAEFSTAVPDKTVRAYNCSGLGPLDRFVALMYPRLSTLFGLLVYPSGVPQSSIFVLLFYNDDRASYLWQEIELVSEL